MEMLQIETVLATILGGSVTTAIARFVIMRALRDLEKLSETVAAIGAKLSAIEVRLAQLDKLDEKASSHDRTITEIQSRLKYERSPSICVTDKARMSEA